MRKIIFTEDEIRQILDLWNQNYSRKAISKKLKLSESAIKNIITGLDRPYKYIGKKFGRLTILERTGTAKNGSPIVKCICECGKIKLNNISNLTVKNNRGTISCGCYLKEINSSKDPWLTEYKAYLGNTVKQRKLIFELTVDEFRILGLGNCFYCGVEPSSKMDVGKGFKNGIDRVNSSKGYVIDNCVSCCWTCNRMKSNMIQNDFFEHIQKIIKHNLQSSLFAISAKISP